MDRIIKVTLSSLDYPACEIRDNPDGFPVYVLDDGARHSAVVSSVISQNSSAKIIPVKIFDDVRETYLSDILLGIQSIIDQHTGIGIINCSWVVPKDPMVEEALSRAMNAGLIIIAAAGNGGYDTGLYSPASMPSAITIGSMHNGEKLLSSNRGPHIDFWMEANGGGTSTATALYSAKAADFISTFGHNLSVQDIHEVLLDQSDFSNEMLPSHGVLAICHPGVYLDIRLAKDAIATSPLPPGMSLIEGRLTGFAEVGHQTTIHGFTARSGAFTRYYEVVYTPRQMTVSEVSSTLGEEIIVMPMKDRLMSYTLSSDTKV